VRFDATGYTTGFQLVEELHGKAPLGSRESTGPASNGVNFSDFKEPSGQIRKFCLSDNCRIDAVSIGRDPMSRPCVSEVQEVSRNFPVQ
jgi:hypothetical protein